MKTIVISILLFGLATQIISADEKEPSKKDFDEQVKKEVDRQIGLIKKKSLNQLAKELLEKDKMLIKRSEGLDKREEQLKMSEESLTKKIADFEGVKNKIIGCMDEHKSSEMLRVKQLVSVVSNMKPQKAAELLSVQDSLISVKLLERIDPKQASKIFNLMDKEVSARLQKQYLNMQQ